MLTSVLSTFLPLSAETAVLYVAGFLAFVLAAYTALTTPRPNVAGGRAVALVAIGLTLWLWPLMWNTVGFAF